MSDTTEKGTLYLRAKQLAGNYIVAAGVVVPAQDVLVDTIHQGLQEAYILGALGRKQGPGREPERENER